MVETWPLFIQFRKTEHYKEFKCKYAKELEHQTINPEDLTDPRSPDKADDLHDLKHTFEEDVDAIEGTASASPQTRMTCADLETTLGVEEKIVALWCSVYGLFLFVSCYLYYLFTRTV